MKAILSFIKDTLTGGILFLIPLIVLYTLYKKAHELIIKIAKPILHILPDTVFGIGREKVFLVITVLLVCFISGLLFRSHLVRKGMGKLEGKLFSKIPGYSMMKAVTVDTLGEEELKHNMSSILVKDDNSWSIGFLVEEANELCTVFIPEAPGYTAGDVKIISSADIQKLNISTKDVVKILKQYGKGAINLLKQK